MLFTTPLGDEAVLVEGEYTEEDSRDNVEHRSFINGIHTALGGKYVDIFRDAIFGPLVRAFNSRKKKVEGKQLKVTAKKLYPYFHLFVRCEFPQPPFKNNQKDLCTLDKFPLYTANAAKEKKEWTEQVESNVTKMLKWGFISMLEEKLLSELDKSNSRKESKTTRSRIPPGKDLVDANDAGSKNGHECILCITEGISALSMLKRGNNDPDRIGGLAIRGKGLNVGKATSRQINANKELQRIKLVLGLQAKTDYSIDVNFKKLRYGGVWALTDSDDDGIHIRGLLLNLFYQEYPSLLQRNYFSGFNTAVVIVWYREPRMKGKQAKRFYNNPEYEQWKESDECHSMAKRIIETKYYKGLGTIEPEETRNYFKDPKIIQYELEGDEEQYMELGFAKKESDQRKKWIVRSLEERGQDNDVPYEGTLGISTFIDQELVIYHAMTLHRALPCIWDGLKESQRKALFSALKYKGKTSRKLVIAGGAAIADSAYHHAPESLYETMIKMGQGFVGSNNIPYFDNDGDYGSRVLGTKEHAAPRYLYFRVEDIIRVIFPEDDYPLYEQIDSEGVSVEYSFYLPIIPMILVNGAEGVACGYSTKIPSYNPEDLVSAIRDWIANDYVVEEREPLVPWYRGFTGSIDLVETDGVYTNWISEGILEEGTKKDKGWYHIRELPIGFWTDNFKNWLGYLEFGVAPEGAKGKGMKEKLEKKCLSEVKDYSTANTVHFKIKPTKEFIPDMDTKGNLDNMRASHPLTNMVAIDENHFPQRFISAEEILEMYCEKRLEFYDKRRTYNLRIYKNNFKLASNKYKYVKAVVEGDLVLHQEDEDLEADMETMGLDRMGDEGKESYDYLLNMTTRSLTLRRMEELKKEVDKWKNMFKVLKGKVGGDLWLEDLDKFDVAYKKFLKTRCDEYL
jgi:DNA topoisomerase-2